MKIHIIGGSGTGKSFLASKLSKSLSIPYYSLDDLQWDNTANRYGVKMPIEKRNAILHGILEKADWIIEGVYYQWVQRSFEEADMIYVLEIPRRIYRYRIYKRFLKRKVGLEKGKKETWQSLKNLLEWTDRYQNVHMKELKMILEKYHDKVIYVKSTKEVKRLIKDYQGKRLAR